MKNEVFAKTLVIAEKPSVAQDIVRALTPQAGKFDKHDDHFENDKYVVTSAVGHLVEIQAPDGFNLLDEDIEVVIDADHTDVSKTIENVPVKELPATGGMGTTVFTLVGLAIMIGSGFVYKKKK